MIGLITNINPKPMSTKNKPGIHLFKGGLTGPKGEVNTWWYWNIVASNGRIIARSSETYTRKSGAVKSIKTAAKIFWDNTNQYMYYDHSKKDSPLTSYL